MSKERINIGERAMGLLEFLEGITGAEDYIDDGRTKRKEIWTSEEQEAYEQIKELIKSAVKE